ncbi:MAG: TlpA family protein disulfide reductase [Sphingomicrobium sp.]
MPNRIALCLLAPLLLLSVGACERERVENQAADIAEAPSKGVDRSQAGKPFPDTEILNADDDPATLGDAQGEPVLINLWASWCAPCVKELPTLDALSRREGAPRVIIVAEEMAERASIEAFLEKHGINDVESWRDPKMALSGALGVQVMPTTVYYDASGREVWRYIGDLDWTGAEAARLLSEAGQGRAL